jgi:hypothetical protein
MANEGFHEAASELSDKTKEMHRAIQSLMEELEAADWYNQRVDACKDEELKAMLLEWIRRTDSAFSKELKDYLFTDKPIAGLEDEHKG